MSKFKEMDITSDQNMATTSATTTSDLDVSSLKTSREALHDDLTFASRSSVPSITVALVSHSTPSFDTELSTFDTELSTAVGSLDNIDPSRSVSNSFLSPSFDTELPTTKQRIDSVYQSPSNDSKVLTKTRSLIPDSTHLSPSFDTELPTTNQGLDSVYQSPPNDTKISMNYTYTSSLDIQPLLVKALMKRRADTFNNKPSPLALPKNENITDLSPSFDTRISTKNQSLDPPLSMNSTVPSLSLDTKSFVEIGSASSLSIEPSPLWLPTETNHTIPINIEVIERSLTDKIINASVTDLQQEDIWQTASGILWMMYLLLKVCLVFLIILCAIIIVDGCIKRYKKRTASKMNGPQLDDIELQSLTSSRSGPQLDDRELQSLTSSGPSFASVRSGNDE